MPLLDSGDVGTLVRDSGANSGDGGLRKCERDEYCEWILTSLFGVDGRQA